MRIKRIVTLLPVLLMFACCCDKLPPEAEGCDREGCFELSDLETRTDHLLPFILYNDVAADLESVMLNGESIEFEFGQAIEFVNTGFFELALKFKGTGEEETILFTVSSSERAHAEWGIATWIPYQFETKSLRADEIIALYPHRFIEGMGVPFIFYARQNGMNMEGYSLATAGSTGQEFYIKHGVGSVMLGKGSINSFQSFDLGAQEVDLELQQVNSYTLELGGTISGAYSIPENSVVLVSDNLNITGPLQIGAGTLILVEEGVNIYNDGPVTILGQIDNPVLITCTESGKYWGGFISNGSESRIEARYTIFCQSGFHNTGEYAGWGHAQRQALFRTQNSELALDHCYMTDHIGQIFYPTGSVLSLDNILVQRAKTSGQLNTTTTEITNSIFTDFPDDTYVYRDEDNDALYINNSDVTISNCIFMFAKDDGVDSGLNEGGVVTVTDSRFEACFHEGAALSSQNDVEKIHHFTGCTFFNCGQGLELGFSSPNHSVYADSCKFLNNGIGIRYGDNYEWSSVSGQMFITRSQSLYNEKDVWNMVRNLWAPRLDRMHFDNVQVSSYVAQYPGLEVVTN